MKVAIPVSGDNICPHFGHCEKFALVDVDETTSSITGMSLVDPPVHEPGVFPRWLHSQGVNIIIAGGMGGRAQSLFDEQGIGVVVGVSEGTPTDIVAKYLQGNLTPI